MSQRVQSTVINSLIVGGTNLLNNLLMVVLFLILTRHLGPEVFGKYYHILAMGWLFFALSTLGTDQLIIRDLAREEDRIRSDVAGIVMFRGVLGLTATLIMMLFGGLLYFPEERCFAIWFYAAGLTLSSLSGVFHSVLASREKFLKKGVCLLSSSTVQLLLTIILVWKNANWSTLVRVR